MYAVNINETNFSDEVIRSDRPVLLDFWAPWCGPCRMLSPIVDRLADKLGDRAKVGKVNVDEQPELAQQFQVMSIPTLLIFQNGKLIQSSVGVKNEQQILEMLRL